MNFFKKVLFGLKVAEKVAVLAGEQGLTIKGINPAQVDAAAHEGAKKIVDTLKKRPGPTPVNTSGE